MLRGGFDDDARTQLREARDGGRLDEMYAELAVGDEEAAERVEAGELVYDGRLAALGAFAEDGGEPGSVPQADDPEAERADVAFEGMRSLSRSQQVLMRQRETLRKRVDRKDAKLAARATDRGGRRLRNVARMLNRGGPGR
jgi:hypothetical protein